MTNGKRNIESRKSLARASTDAEGAAVWPRELYYQDKHGAKCAAVFLKHRMPRRIIVSDGIIYSYERDGLYQEMSEAALAAEIRATDKRRFLDVDHIQKTIRAIHHQCAVQKRPFEWIKMAPGDPLPDDMVLFRNGRLDLRTLELTPHDGRYFATGCPDYDYDEWATCPKWEACLKEWLDPSLHDTLHEYAGLLLTPDTRLEKMLVLVGTARSGKSTIARVLSLLCGKQHFTSCSLDDLGGDFGLQGCLDKRMMLIPDAHDTQVNRRNAALSRIKAIVGRDELSINRKNIKMISAIVPVRIVMVANRHPSFIDESGALAQRELLLTFGNSFVGREDRDLSKKLEREMSGIANLAILGLARLRKNNNRFTIGSAMEEATLQLHRDQSPALDFAMTCLTVTRDDADFIPDHRLYDLYSRYCKEKGINGRLRRRLNDLKADLVAAFGKGVRQTQRRLQTDAYDRPLTRSVRTYGLAGIARPVLTPGWNTPPIGSRPVL